MKPESIRNEGISMIVTGIVLLILIALLNGCAVISIHNPATEKLAFRAWVPAWPWQDTTASFSRMNISAKTNSFTASMRDLSQTETTSTNLTDLVSAIVTGTLNAVKK